MKKLWMLAAFCLLLTGCNGEVKEVGITEPVPETEVPVTQAETTEPIPDPVEVLLQSMTPEEKIGQMFLARCPGPEYREEAAKYHLGGWLLFGQDFAGQTWESMTEILSDYQAAAKIPLLLAVDEEGGTVRRVSAVPELRAEPFLSPGDLYDRGGMELVLSTESEKAYLLHSLGLNVNLAPVVDISPVKDSFMYQRSLRQSPEITGEFAAGTVERMAECQVGSVLKHFPGYGSNADTHAGIVEDHRPLEVLEANDLLPFASGIQAGCGGILMSHNIVDALDSEYPVSLSPAAHTYLRDMGFEGVILTDELSMGAIANAYGEEEAAVLAVLAGNDLLCVTDYPNQYQAVAKAVADGRIPMELIDRAAERVLRWKQALGLIG